MRLAVFEQALGDFKGERADFEPALITTGDTARAFDVFDALERTIVAGKTLVASRATEGGEWRDLGYKSPAAGLDQRTGSGFGPVIAMLETSGRLPGGVDGRCPR